MRSEADKEPVYIQSLPLGMMLACACRRRFSLSLPFPVERSEKKRHFAALLTALQDAGAQSDRHRGKGSLG